MPNGPVMNECSQDKNSMDLIPRSKIWVTPSCLKPSISFNLHCIFRAKLKISDNRAFHRYVGTKRLPNSTQKKTNFDFFRLFEKLHVRCNISIETQTDKSLHFRYLSMWFDTRYEKSVLQDRWVALAGMKLFLNLYSTMK